MGFKLDRRDQSTIPTGGGMICERKQTMAKAVATQ